VTTVLNPQLLQQLGIILVATVVTCKYLHLLLQALQSFLGSFSLWVYPAKESFVLLELGHKATG
jgi:hypothetical protein